MSLSCYFTKISTYLNIKLIFLAVYGHNMCGHDTHKTHAHTP